MATTREAEARILSKKYAHLVARPTRTRDARTRVMRRHNRACGEKKRMRRGTRGKAGRNVEIGTL